VQFSPALARIVAAAALIALAGTAAAQQAYPAKPIHFLVPYTPGGPMDILTRLVGQKLAESWSQPVIVENRPGGNTFIGMDALAKSAPDGYTISIAASSLVLVPLLLPAPYDPIKDFAPVATFARAEYVLLINPSVPANNLKELIVYAKSKPGQLNYAASGAGGPQQLGFELLNLAAEIKTQYIPYKGASQALADLLAGQVQMYFSTIATAIPHIKSGKVKAIAISGSARSPALAQVPTFAEAGLAGLDGIGVWYGVIAPAGTPKVIIDKMSAEIGKFTAMPDFKEKLASQGFNVFFSTSEPFAALLKADMAKNVRIIKAANIKLDN